jgi:hypothetical protein
MWKMCNHKKKYKVKIKKSVDSGTTPGGSYILMPDCWPQRNMYPDDPATG